MRTSLHNIKETDDYLHGHLLPQDVLLFEAHLLIDDDLAANTYWHKQTLNIVNKHGRNNLRALIADVQQQLFTQPAHSGFRQKILRLFK